MHLACAQKAEVYNGRLAMVAFALLIVRPVQLSFLRVGRSSSSLVGEWRWRMFTI